MARLLAAASVEIPVGHLSELGRAASLLPAGCCAYVPSLPGQSFETTLRAVSAIRDAGLDPVPHLAARSIDSAPALVRFLRRAAGDAGVHRVLLVGGDPDASGAFSDSAAVLRAGVIGEAGVSEVGLAGFPDGHPHVPDGRALLAEKFALIEAQGATPCVVTQFTFTPGAIEAFSSQVARRFPRVGVRAGIPGPTNPAALLRYARRCGVDASRRALRRFGADVARLALRGDPTAQLESLARDCARRPESAVVGIHVYSFGGVVRAARFMRETQERCGDEAVALS